MTLLHTRPDIGSNRKHDLWPKDHLKHPYPTLLKMEFEGGGVVLKCHFKIPFLQSCFLNDQYSSSLFHVIGKFVLDCLTVPLETAASQRALKRA